MEWIKLIVGFWFPIGLTLYLTDTKNKEDRFNEEMQRSLNVCFKKYFDFEGTADRNEFWYFSIWAFILSFWLLGVDNWSNFTETLTNKTPPTFWDAWILQTIWDVAMIFPACAVGARRLHAIGKSGWWQLIVLTGIGLILLIYWWAQPGGKSYKAGSKSKYSTKKDVSEELKELNKLYKDKAITKAEFSRAKKKLLD